MANNCSHPTCEGEECRREKKPKKVYTIKPKPGYKIPKISKKQAKQNNKYAKKRLRFLQDNPACAVCGGIAGEIHHRKGRNEFFLDETTFLPVCRPCHRWIEENPLQSVEMGYSESRLNNKDKAA